MSQNLTAIDLTNKAVGYTTSVSTVQASTGIALEPIDGIPPRIQMFNESGAGLDIEMISGRSFVLPAGAWRTIPLGPRDVSFKITILYVLINAPVNTLLMTFFDPGEQLPDIGILGNSPIGLSGSLNTSVNQVINDGNPAVATVLEANPSTGPNAGVSSAKISNDGSGYLSGGKLIYDNAGDVTAIFYKANGAAGPYFQVVLPSAVTDIGNNAFDIIDNTVGAIHWEVGKNAHVNGDHFRVIDVTNGVSTLDILPNNTGLITVAPVSTGKLQSIASQATAGSFGVPVSVASAEDVAVAVNTQTTILSFTTPNDGKNHLVRFNADFRIGSGNTNIGVITLGAHYTDDSGNTATLAFTDAGSIVAFLAVNRNKGLSYHGFPITVNVAPNVVVQINYTNAAAGTISDHVTGFIELLT